MSLPAPLRAVMPLFNFFQLAYVVDDIDRGTDEMTRLYGIDRFRVSREVAIQTADGSAQLHFALAFVGALQIELIQPAGGADGAYRSALSSRSTAAQLHHVGHLIRSERNWRAAQRAIGQSGLSVPVSGTFAHANIALMHYAYVDTRASLGHLLEFMYQTTAGRALFADVPRFGARSRTSAAHHG